ncbi:MAG: hypothetical protein GX639_08625 [Fibrobacter sp.]|nr:hypothetical protein [Fibrobacter sp.]
MQYQDLCPSDNKNDTIGGDDYTTSISAVRNQCQKQLLTDEELALITFDEIIHSYTRDEINYQ